MQLQIQLFFLCIQWSFYSYMLVITYEQILVIILVIYPLLYNTAYIVH